MNFDAQTKAKADGRTRVLLMDGHSSHYTHELLVYARENNIIILGYPPHCTHALQGLDVVCFARMKEMWKQEIEAHELLHRRGVAKADFASVFGRAYLQAFTTDTIQAAFRATGVHPFDRTVITVEQMKPSIETSVKGSFPLPQPSPVRAVIAAFRHQPPTTFDTDEDTHMLPPSSSPSRMLADTPTRKRARAVDPTIDPDLYTPRKRIRLMSASLSSTMSGSYLVSNVRMHSSQPIFTPVIDSPPLLPAVNWAIVEQPAAMSGRVTMEELEARNRELSAELQLAKQHVAARDIIIEGDRAQLVVQHLVLKKQNDALHVKETKKASDRTRLFADGKGRVLTADDFIEKVKDIQTKKITNDAAKEARLKARGNKRAARAALEDEWKDMQKQHQIAVEAWQARCARLTEQGARKKDLPRKPMRPKKPTLGPEEDVDSEEDDDDDL